MSIERCDKHNYHHDTDFQLECPRCEVEYSNDVVRFDWFIEKYRLRACAEEVMTDLRYLVTEAIHGER